MASAASSSRGGRAGSARPKSAAAAAAGRGGSFGGVGRSPSSTPSSSIVAPSSATTASGSSKASAKPRKVRSAAAIDDDDDIAAVTITPRKSSSTSSTASTTTTPPAAASAVAPVKRPKSPAAAAAANTSPTTSVDASTTAKAKKSPPAKKGESKTIAAASTPPPSSSTASSSSRSGGSDEKKGVNPWRSVEPVFSAADMAFFEQHGYVVLKEAVSRADCEAVVNDIWKFLGFSPESDGLDSCYCPPLNPNALVEMYHSQAQWNNRCNARIYSAFCQLWGRDDLWCSLDRVGVKLPSVEKHPHYRNKGFTHWDFDITDDVEYFPLQLQGALALVDTDPTMGGFHCYPGMHKYLKEWMLENNVKIEESAVKRFYSSGFPIKVPNPETCLRMKTHHVVEMKAGDLVIWRGELAHGNGENLSTRPRLAQYITMHPQRWEDEQLRAKRVECWRKRFSGGQVLWPQLPLANAHGKTGGVGTKSGAESRRPIAELTDLGKLLLGVEPWPDHLLKL